MLIEQLEPLLAPLAQAKTIQFAPDFNAAHLASAAANSHLGLAHLAGETLVAHVDDTEHANNHGISSSYVQKVPGYNVYGGVRITDRRILGFSEKGAFDIPYTHLTGSELNGTIVKDLVFTAGNRRFVCPMLEGQKEVVLFARQLLSQVPFGARENTLDTPLFQPNEHDPTGAGGVLARMASQVRSPDALCARILSMPLMFADGSRGVSAEQAQGLAERAALLERNEHFGRGQYHGYFLSPLPPQDLEFLLVLAFGNAERRHVDPNNVLHNHFILGGKLNVGSNVLGAASAAIIGIGWRSVPIVRDVHVQIYSFGPFSGFRIRITSRNCDDDGERDMVRHHATLMHLQTDEKKALVLRGLYGWQWPLHEHWHTPWEQLAHELSGLLSGE